MKINPKWKEIQEKRTQWIIDNIDKETVRKYLPDSEVLEIFKNLFSFKINNEPFPDGTYMLKLKDRSCDDYMYIYISEEEKNILKEWLNEDKS